MQFSLAGRKCAKWADEPSLKSLCNEIIKFSAFLVPTNVFFKIPKNFSRRVDVLILGISAKVLFTDMWGDARVP